ncbi:MAG: SRPBCC family protein [Sandaracinaceae bacterium]
MRVAGIARGAWLLAALLLVSSAALAQGDGFSLAEVHSLDAGELVRRPIMRRRGGLTLIGGTSYQIVEQPVGATWEVLSDLDQYGRMLRSAEEVRVVSSDGERAVLHIRHRYGPVHAQYHLRMALDHEAQAIRFRLDPRRPSDLRAAWGFLETRPYGDGEHTLLTWGVMADPGGGLLGGLIRGQIQGWMLEVPSDIRRFIHRRVPLAARR